MRRRSILADSRNDSRQRTYPRSVPKSAASWGRPGSTLRRSIRPVSSASRMAIPGLLRFFDLANVGSVSAILTGDLGVIQDGTVRVLGRAEDGEARGCALGMEQFAAKRELTSAAAMHPHTAQMNRATTSGTAVAGSPASKQRAADSSASVSATASIAQAATRMRSAERCSSRSRRGGAWPYRRTLAQTRVRARAARPSRDSRTPLG